MTAAESGGRLDRKLNVEKGIQKGILKTSGEEKGRDLRRGRTENL